MHKNILTVVGITILFLGLTINPAVAVNPIPSDNEEDCDICPKVDNLQLGEKYQELFDRITTLKEMNKEYESGLSWDFPIIRGILKIITILIENISYALFIIVLGLGVAILLIIIVIYILYSFIEILLNDLLNR